MLNQKICDLEYILIDGASSDSTLDIIKKYETKIDYWISEPDLGIYDAMNKGIKLASGRYLLFLNSGDYIVGDVLSNVKSAPIFLPIVYETVFKNKVFQKIKPYCFGIPVSHQGIIFENKGMLYDDNYKYASDYDYFLKHGYDSNVKILDCDGYIYYDNNGLSKINSKVRDHEIKTIIAKNFNIFYVLIFDFICFTKILIRFVLVK